MIDKRRLKPQSSICPT